MDLMDQKEYQREYHKEYREKNREKIKIRQKEYDRKNKDKKKEYYEKNKEQLKEQKKEYYEENKEQIIEQIKEYRKTPKGKKVFRITNWKKQGIIFFDFDLLYEIYLSTTHCEFCDVELTEDRFNTSTTRCLDHDHSITDCDNVRNILCISCNSSRQ